MTSPVDLGPPPRLGYTQGTLARAAERRGDPTGLAALAADPAAGFCVMGGDLVVLKAGAHGHDPLFGRDEAHTLGAPRETVFLGLSDGAGRFAIGLEPGAVETLTARTDLVVTDLRSIAVQGLVAPEHLPVLAEAKALLNWHARHRFCSHCGGASQPVDAGWRRDCPSCGALHFPRTDPVVIMLVIDGDRCLLGRSPRFLSGMWSCLAGFVEPGETIEEAVRRETLEEAGVHCGAVRYFASQPWPFPASLMIGCHAEAISRDILVDRNELEDARWFSRDEVTAMLLRRHPDGLGMPPPIAIAHHIIRAWIEGHVDGFA